MSALCVGLHTELLKCGGDLLHGIIEGCGFGTRDTGFDSCFSTYCVLRQVVWLF